MNQRCNASLSAADSRVFQVWGYKPAAHQCNSVALQSDATDLSPGNNFPLQIWLANSVKRKIFQTRFCTLLWRKTATQKISCIAVIKKLHSKLRCDTRNIIPCSRSRTVFSAHRLHLYLSLTNQNLIESYSACWVLCRWSLGSNFDSMKFGL